MALTLTVGVVSSQWRRPMHTQTDMHTTMQCAPPPCPSALTQWNESAPRPPLSRLLSLVRHLQTNKACESTVGAGRRQLALLAGTVAALQPQHTLPSPLLASLARRSPSPVAHWSQLQPPPPPPPGSDAAALHRNLFVSVLVLSTPAGEPQASRPSVADASEAAASAEAGGAAPLMVVTHHAALLHARVIIPSSWVRRTGPLQKFGSGVFSDVSG